MGWKLRFNRSIPLLNIRHFKESIIPEGVIQEEAAQ